MELGPEIHNGDGLLGPNSIMVVYMDPLGNHWGGAPNYSIVILKPESTHIAQTQAVLGVGSASSPLIEVMRSSPVAPGIRLAFKLGVLRFRVLEFRRLG